MIWIAFGIGVVCGAIPMFIASIIIIKLRRQGIEDIRRMVNG